MLQGKDAVGEIAAGGECHRWRMLQVKNAVERKLCK